MTQVLGSIWKIIGAIATLGGFAGAFILLFGLFGSDPEDRALAGSLRLASTQANDGAPSLLERLKEANEAFVETLEPIWTGADELANVRNDLNSSDFVSEFDLVWKGPSDCLVKGECRAKRLPDECKAALNYIGELITLIGFQSYAVGGSNEDSELFNQIPATYRSAVACSSVSDTAEAANSVAANYLRHFYEEALSRRDHKTIARLAKLPNLLVQGLEHPIPFEQASNDARHAPNLDLANRVCRTVADFAANRDYSANVNGFRAFTPSNQVGTPYPDFLRIRINEWDKISASLQYAFFETEQGDSEIDSARTLIKHCSPPNTYSNAKSYQPSMFLLFNYKGDCDYLTGLRLPTSEVHLFLCQSDWPSRDKGALNMIMRRAL